MSRKVRRDVVFTEQFYYPEGWGGAQLPRDVTMHLARGGLAVEVICGSDCYAPVEGDAGADPADAGVRVRRIPRLFGGDVHHFKLLRQLWFCFAAMPLLLLGPRPRVFVTQTNPPFIVPLIALVAWVLRRPFIIVAQDLYPEVLFAHGMLAANSLAARLLGVVFGWAYRRAARVVSLGPVMSQRLAEKGVPSARLVSISNWATGDERIVRGPENRLLEPWGLVGCFVILYSGNLGIAHDVQTPIRALRDCLADLPRLRLVFIGQGGRLPEARQLAEELGVSDAVQFRSWVPAELLPHSLGVASVALVTLRPGFAGLVVPSKLLGYMARGIPSVYVGPPSDAQRLIDDSGGGLCAANGDTATLSHIFRSLAHDSARLQEMGRAAQTFYNRHMARDIGLEQYRKVLEQVGNPRQSAA